MQSEFTKGEKGKVIPSNTTIKAKLSIRSQEPTKIKVLKVHRNLNLHVEDASADLGFISCRVKWEPRESHWKHIKHM